MTAFTVVGIHDSGMGLIRWFEAETPQEALGLFDSRNEGVALAVFEGKLTNTVPRNLWPDSDGIGIMPKYH